MVTQRNKIKERKRTHTGSAVCVSSLRFLYSVLFVVSFSTIVIKFFFIKFLAEWSGLSRFPAFRRRSEDLGGHAPCLFGWSPRHQVPPQTRPLTFSLLGQMQRSQSDRSHEWSRKTCHVSTSGRASATATENSGVAASLRSVATPVFKKLHTTLCVALKSVC